MIRRGLSTEGNLRFKIDWASPIVGSKKAFLLCFTFYFNLVPRAFPLKNHPFFKGKALGTRLFLFEGNFPYFRNFTVYDFTEKSGVQLLKFFAE